MRDKSWEKYFSSKMMGFVQSRLYQGSWNLEGLIQNFNLEFMNKSWMDTKLNKSELKDVFNSSSFACRSLINILRWNSKIRKPRYSMKIQKGRTLVKS
jgi:hypothetical protein